MLLISGFHPCFGDPKSIAQTQYNNRIVHKIIQCEFLLSFATGTESDDPDDPGAFRKHESTLCCITFVSLNCSTLGTSANNVNRACLPFRKIPLRRLQRVNLDRYA